MAKPEEVDEELEWLRGITGKQTISDEDVKGVGSYPLPDLPGPHFRKIKSRSELEPRPEG